jgi:hypothetical protein
MGQASLFFWAETPVMNLGSLGQEMHLALVSLEEKGQGMISD